ncbi:hypothetical protein [Marinicella gelatinilytica]|uniref:hypothetical protein n=1 Tax=Marinicella gelatinilytica TaxID=2996017 RepID=UPI002260E61E|nr:hypothetical protein [Marinicella gelatinilytica]MCX7544157.1 hypothetical protein [Marinicella gelatinilytica]
MAGYLFSLSNVESLIESINLGVYSTLISTPKNNTWRISQEGTFADFCSMKDGDNVYFFYKRKIYGIGKLVNINGSCKFLNYPKANVPENQNYQDIKSDLLYDNGENSVNNRFICTFEPLPFFFKDGIDMDETLSSAPDKFRILRAFWKLSFIKFSDTENQAFKDIILRRNIEAINNPDNNNTYESNYLANHEFICKKTKNNNDYELNIAPFLNTINNLDGSIKHEMAIEAALIYQLSNNLRETVDIFGNWDYLTHQVIASPFKPIDFMDKMDVFGYKYIQNQNPTISDYLVVEIKKDLINSQDLIQLMKYVDWVKNEYAYGDYSMIKAFMLGFKYSEDALDTYRINIERKYIKGVRPSISKEWNDVKLIQYKLNQNTDLLEFEDITPSE